MELKKLVEELKEIALLRAQQAGDLAYFARQLESDCCPSEKSEEYTRAIARSHCMYVQDKYEILYSELDARETEILSKIMSQ